MRPPPSDIKLHSKSRVLEVTFEEARFQLPCEYLRVHSPSAEVQGHGPGQEVLQTGKETVNIVAIEPVGHYAVRLIFDDAHNSGIYSWDYLYNLGQRRVEMWRAYLRKLEQAEVPRESQDSDKYLEC